MRSNSAALPWLDESPPGPSDTITGWLGGVESAQQPSGEAADTDGLPDWLVGATAAGIGFAAGAAANKDHEQEPKDKLTSPEEPEIEDSTALIAEFDQEFTQDIDGGSMVEAPDWLSDLETAEALDTEPGGTGEAEAAEIPDWLVGAAAAQGVSDLLDSRETAEEDALAAEEMMPEPAGLESALMDEPDELPDWMTAAAPEDEFETELSDELPDWLAEAQPTPELLEALELSGGEDQLEPEVADEAAQSDAVVEQVEPDLDDSKKPGWLAGAAAGAVVAAAAMAGSEDETPEPADLQPEVGEPEMVAALSAQSDLVAEPDLPGLDEPFAEIEEAVSPEEEEAAFAWLEGLAAKQGTSEALFLSPDERLDEPPDWVQMEAALAAGALALDGEAEQALQAEETVEIEQVLAEEPTEMEALTDATAAIPEMFAQDEAEEAIQELPVEEPSLEDLEALAAELVEGDIPADAVSMEDLLEDTSSEEFLPDWLRAAGPESEVAQARAELDEETEIHAWLSQVDQPAEMTGEITGAIEISETGDEGALDWLPELPDEVDLSEVLAEEGEDQVLSDWLSRMPAEAAAVQAAVEDEQAGQTDDEQPERHDIPAWMVGAAAATIALGREAEDEQAAASAEAEPVDALPEWLEGPEPETDETQEVISAEIFDAGEQEFSPEDTQPTAVAAVVGVEPATAESAVQGLEEILEADSDLAGEVTAEEVKEELSDEDEAFAWLESLAVKQGASEALLLDPDERREEPPEWVLEESLHADEPVEIVERGEQFELAEDETADRAELLEEISQVKEAEDDDLPEWLIGAGAAAGAAAAAMLVGDEDEPEGAVAADMVLETPAADLPDIEAEIDELIPADELPELPDWLADLEPGSVEEGEWLPEMAGVATISAIDEELQITPLDINKASLIEIERLPGVGFRRAQSVIEYRQEHGAFESLDELEAVEGFDSEMVEELVPYLHVTGSAKTEESFQEEIEVDLLIEARAAIYKADISAALDNYQSLIEKRQSLPEVVKDLEEALYTHPVDVSIWMTLGDAQMRAGQLHKALESYNKAEELLV